MAELNRRRGRCLLYSALTVLVKWISRCMRQVLRSRELYETKEPATTAREDVRVEITDGPMPQVTSPKSRSSSDADRENPISCRLDEVVAYYNPTSRFLG